jgi:hypothetical protein
VIRPLRRAHGVASLLLALTVLALLAAAISLRVTPPATPAGTLGGRP